MMLKGLWAFSSQKAMLLVSSKLPQLVKAIQMSTCNIP